MNTVIEKVTLYDILGYLIPGIVFEILTGLEIILEILLNTGNVVQLKEAEKYVTDINGIVMLAFVVLAYCIGIMISELASITERMIVKKCFKLRLSDKLVIDLEAIKAALKKSKLIQEEVTENDIKSGKYERLMYADVQINDKCKRIHNYVSAKIMYRNLMFSIVISVLVNVLVRTHGYDLFHVTYMGQICCVAAVIMWMRWIRFYAKCKEYTLYWFLEINK